MNTIQWKAHPPPRVVHEVQELSGEHGVLARRLASLQDRVSRQIAEHANQVRVLQAEVVRLRGRLLQARTALLWGLARSDLRDPAQAVSRSGIPTRRLSLVNDALPEAHAVICQTGCTGHAHAWLEADGVCRRTGAACDAGATAEASSMPFSSHPVNR